MNSVVSMPLLQHVSCGFDESLFLQMGVQGVMVAGIHGRHEEAGVVTGKIEEIEDMGTEEGEREVMEAEEGERGGVARGEAGPVDGQTMRADPVKAGTDSKLQSLIRFSFLGIVDTIRHPCDLETCYL